MPLRTATLVLALVAGAAGVFGLATADDGIERRSAVVAGVPVEVVRPARATGALPGVVVAHGLAASRQLMRGFADTLARRGYAVELVDLAGHGASTERLPGMGDGPAAEARLDRDLDVAVGHLRALPWVDRGRIGLLGHSMGAAAVVRYAAAHPAIRATVSISQGEMPLQGSASRPRDLLLLAGGLEFTGYRDGALAALRAAYPRGRTGVTYGDPRAGTARRAVIIGGVEHVGVLFSPRTHREVSAWFDAAFDRPTADGPGVGVRPVQRAGSAMLLHLAAVLGFGAIAGALLGRPPAQGGEQGPGTEPPQRGRPGPGTEPPQGGEPGLGTESDGERRRLPLPLALAVPAVAVAAAVPAMAAVPGGLLPLAVAGPLAGFLGVIGAVLLAATRWPGRLAGRGGGTRNGGTGSGHTGNGHAGNGQAGNGNPGSGHAENGRTGDRGVRDGRRLPRGGGPDAGRRSWPVTGVAAAVLVAMTVVSFAVPAQWGWAHAVPVGPRAGALVPVTACAAVFFGGVEALCAGYGRTAAAAVHAWTAAGTLAGLCAAALIGVASPFVLLVAPLLAALLVWQGVQAAVLRALQAPVWLTALVGGVLLAWPIAVTMPIG